MQLLALTAGGCLVVVAAHLEPTGTSLAACAVAFAVVIRDRGARR